MDAAKSPRFVATVTETTPPSPLFDRLGGRARLLYLLRHFYADVRQHEDIGPIFSAHITDWPAHLEKIADFWRNPFYLFAVKKADWSFENEWRMIKKGTDCDHVEGTSNEELFLCDVKTGMIHSIIFGYSYNETAIKKDIENMISFDPTIQFNQAKINLNTDRIEIMGLSR